MQQISKQINTIALAAFLSLGLVRAAPAEAQVTRDVSKYNLFVPGENLNGYDPVSYFPEGGGQPQPGSQELQLTYMGVTYFFASLQNAETFQLNPEKYEPTYGQWCARAMAEGSYVKINPMIFMIHGNRLHFFVSKRAKEFFIADLENKEASADGHWKRFTGEDPRL